MFKYLSIERYFVFFLAILIASIAIGSPWFQSYTVVDILDYKGFIVAITFILSLPLILNKKTNNNDLSFIEAILLIFFLYSSLSFFWTANDFSDLLLFLRDWNIYFYSFITFLVFYRFYDYERHGEKLFLFLTIASMFISALFLSQYFFSFPGQDILVSASDGASFRGHYGSTFGNRNAPGQVILYILPLSLLSLSTNKSILVKVISSISLLFGLVVLYLINSAAIWLGLIAMFSIFSIVYFKSFIVNVFSKKNTLLVLGLVFSILLSAMFIQANKLESGKEESNYEQNLIVDLFYKVVDKNNTRKSFWQTSLINTSDHPFFGGGLGSYVAQQQRLGTHINNRKAHNEFVEIYAELGLVGLLVFLTFIFSVLWESSKFLFSESIANNNPIVFFYSLIGVFIISLFSYPFWHIGSVVLISIFFAALLNFLKKNSKDSEIKLPKFFSYFKYLVIIVLIVSPFIQHQWITNLNNFYTYSGFYPAPLNKNKLKDSINSPLLISYIVNSANVHLGNGKKKQNTEEVEFILSLVSSMDSDNSFSLWKEFEIMYKKNDVKNAEILYKKMKLSLPENPLTFDAGLKLAVLKKDIQLAANVYSQFKELMYKDAESFFHDYRIYIFMIDWSIKTENFLDTEFAYKFFNKIRNKELGLELKMADLYYRLKKYKKSASHFKYVLDRKPKAIKREVIDFLFTNKLIDHDYKD